jgi:beta-xylosidase
MRQRRTLQRSLILTTVIAVMTGVILAAQAGFSPSSSNYLFAYFVGNGEDGLHLASSRDGLAWTALKGGASFLTPAVGTKLMRDPCVVRGPDGTFHMVWTTGWWDNGIGVAYSKDLIEWSEQQFVPVMAHEPKALNAWAPEIVWDAAKSQYLVFWSSTIPGRFPDTDASGSPLKEGGRTNHRIYSTTTKDFRTWTPTQVFYDDGFNAIDATIAQQSDRFVMVVKDETQFPAAKKHLRVATSTRIDGPYGHASAPISIDWVEGPSLLRTGDSWLLYYDEYTRHRYGALRSSDLVTWRPVTEPLTFPSGVRHGTAFSVPPDVAARLATVKSASSQEKEN